MSWPLSATGALSLTEDTAGASWAAGFLRRPSDGALVATTVTAGASWQRGFLRSATGALAYSTAAAASVVHGLARDAAGALATVGVDPDAQYAGGASGADDLRQHGLKFEPGTKRVYAAVVP